MILYDDKHKFLGMSSHTLSFLGYEDINDFLSMHNDFANLFVNKEGYIYNFDNFNWIDFVLYSGAANKSALIKLKNSKETKVDISIKEIHLANDVNNMKKIYSVKILSDNFNEISNTPKTETTGFSLSGLVTKEAIPETKQEEVSLVTSTPEPTTIEAPKNESFILNIADEELTTKEETLVPNMVINDNKSEDNDSDFKLDFFRGEEHKTEEVSTEEVEQEVHDSTEKESDFLLKHQNTEDQHISFTQEDTQPKQESESAFEFNMLKEEQEDTTSTLKQSDESVMTKPDTLDINNDEVSEPIVANLEKEVDDSDKTPVAAVAPSINDSGFKLDFLKTDLIQEDSTTKDETLSLVPESTEHETSSNNQEIIQQIKDDIKEIDGDNSKEERSISFEEPQSAQVEQPIEFETKMDITQEEFSSFQVQESQTSNTDSSFTSTLKGLFAGAAVASTATALTSNTEEKEEEKEEEENNFSFNLKSDKTEKEEFSLPKTEQQVSLKDKIAALNVQEDTQEEIKEEIKEHHTQEFSTSLSGLGLDPDDEFNLLSDFIADSKESIATIEQFTYTKDFDKINYALVKIKSSAEILNLNDIIDNATSMRKHCITENSEEVTAETQRLKDNISMLEKHLEATAI